MKEGKLSIRDVGWAGQWKLPITLTSFATGLADSCFTALARKGVVSEAFRNL